MAVLEVLDRHGERGAKEADLPLPRAVVHQLLKHGLELRREELVRLVAKRNTNKRERNVGDERRAQCVSYKWMSKRLVESVIVKEIQ